MHDVFLFTRNLMRSRHTQTHTHRWIVFRRLSRATASIIFFIFSQTNMSVTLCYITFCFVLFYVLCICVRVRAIAIYINARERIMLLADRLHSVNVQQTYEKIHLFSFSRMPREWWCRTMGCDITTTHIVIMMMLNVGTVGIDSMMIGWKHVKNAINWAGWMRNESTAAAFAKGLTLWCACIQQKWFVSLRTWQLSPSSFFFSFSII